MEIYNWHCTCCFHGGCYQFRNTPRRLRGWRLVIICSMAVRCTWCRSWCSRCRSWCTLCRSGCIGCRLGCIGCRSGYIGCRSGCYLRCSCLKCSCLRWCWRCKEILRFFDKYIAALSHFCRSCNFFFVIINKNFNRLALALTLIVCLYLRSDVMV